MRSGSRISLRNLLDSMLAELIHMSIVTTWSVGKSQANSTTTWTCRRALVSYPHDPSHASQLHHVAALIQDCKASGLWSLHSFYETSAVFFGNEHLTKQKPESSMRLDATRYTIMLIMLKNVANGCRIVTHTLAACSTPA